MKINNNPLQLYKLLPGDNCRQCYLPSCMAFAAAVIAGEKRLTACPRLDPAVLARLEAEFCPRRSLADEQADRIGELRQQVAGLDFAALASRLGAVLRGESLVISCLGKDFVIDPAGRLSSECHVNPWVQLPLLRYLLVCQGAAERGEWLPMAELAQGAAVAPLFAKRCELPLRQLADRFGEDFFELLSMFRAKVEGEPDGDRVALLRPLPRVPFRLAYQPPEEGLDSTLRITFDRSAEQNATPEMLHFLASGMAEMWEKILQSLCHPR
ncbi:MAG TPA: DUF3786 domain-containing protein [Desulfurivibrio alkaliphilus]|uniref:DUF3786 domain-containing protein n=1 Tax=Desulfurivibrio alkaliphilus TaxID=427923 RepID=A0A7C2TFZ8_9BACT|nr:DUF3786 domain-containing protein [Desulfurivibrio alkaliphilus]